MNAKIHFSKAQKAFFSLSLCCLLTTTFTFSQTFIAGQVNEYALFQSQDNCTNTITVNDASSFETGMGLIIIQMVGAVIEQGNSDNFGTITNQNGVGQYEYNAITAINGNDISLEFALQNNYLSNQSQVVGFQIHENAIVADNIYPQAWNGITGGIIAIETTDTLWVSDTISANGMGFRGGAGIEFTDIDCSFLTFNTRYFYEAGNWRGAPKGEGCAAFINNKENGRGAQANGGGGGNNHNSGGGGGANVNNGGLGGENNDPSFGGCDGFYPGEGARPLMLDETLVYMGGGGGAGHGNNFTNSGGGNGGGIVFIKANVLIFNGGQISADGLDGGSTIGDGGGGGGAGGTIVLDINQAGGTPLLSAIGGKGGTIDNGDINRCFGPGGGGSGGHLLTTVVAPISIDGGQAGLSTNSTACDEGTNGALSGGLGIININFSGFSEGLMANAPSISAIEESGFVCIGQSVTFQAQTTGNNFELQWQINTSGTWSNISNSSPFSGAHSTELTIDVYELGNAMFRLILTPDDLCFSAITSDEFSIEMIQQPIAAPSFTINGTSVDFLANANNADTYFWQFTDTDTSNEENPTFDFGQTGTYTATLQVSNDCSSESYIVDINIGNAPQANFSANFNAGCAPLYVQFTDESTGDITTREWTFEGGDPASSTAESLIVEFANPGTYQASLSLSNESGTSEAEQTIEVLVPPSVNFSYEVDGLQIAFTNLSVNATLFSWDFDDSQESSEVNPIHTFDTPGVYEVTLNAQNEYCGIALSQIIDLLDTSTDDLEAHELDIYPNPATTELFIKGDFENLSFYDTNGKLIHHSLGTTTNTVTDISSWPAGVYFLKIHTTKGVVSYRVLKL